TSSGAASSASASAGTTSSTPAATTAGAGTRRLSHRPKPATSTPNSASSSQGSPDSSRTAGAGSTPSVRARAWVGWSTASTSRTGEVCVALENDHGEGLVVSARQESDENAS